MDEFDLLALTIKDGSWSSYTASAVSPVASPGQPFSSLLTLGGSPMKPKTKGNKMRPRLSIRTMLIAGALFRGECPAPSTEEFTSRTGKHRESKRQALRYRR